MITLVVKVKKYTRKIHILIAKSAYNYKVMLAKIIMALYANKIWFLAIFILSYEISDQTNFFWLVAALVKKKKKYFPFFFSLCIVDVEKFNAKKKKEKNIRFFGFLMCHLWSRRLMNNNYRNKNKYVKRFFIFFCFLQFNKKTKNWLIKTASNNEATKHPHNSSATVSTPSPQLTLLATTSVKTKLLKVRSYYSYLAIR